MQFLDRQQVLGSCLQDDDILKVIEVIEFDFNAYPSLRFTQNALKCLKTLKEQSLADEIQFIFSNPRILLIRHPEFVKSDVEKWLVSTDHNGRNVPIIRQMVANYREVADPLYVAVVLLNPTEKEGKKCLSDSDKELLKHSKGLIDKQQDTFFVLYEDEESSNHDYKYTEKCFENISREIQVHLGDTDVTENVLSNLFLSSEKLIPTRIGLVLQSNVLDHVRNLVKKIELMTKEMDSEVYRLKRNKEKNTFKIGQLLICEMTKYCQGIINKKKLYGNFKKIMLGLVRNQIIKRYLKADSENIDCLVKQPLDVLLKYLSLCYGSFSSFKRKLKKQAKKKTSPLFIITTYQKRDINDTARKTYEELMKRMKDIVKKRKDSFMQLDAVMVNELNARSDNVKLHRVRTLVQRNEKVKGFGFTNGTVNVFLKNNSPKDKKDVEKFLAKHLDTSKFCVNIEYQRRDLTPFSTLQQGSRIKKDQGPVDGLKNYGSLGMFLQDKNETYFFTTCAHVIGEKSIAFSSEDNTILGESVFVFEADGKGTGDQPTGIDFSLIKLRPEKEITCNLGLKTPDSNFIIGQIYNGEIEEIRGCNVYKWGAAEPHMQKGKCIGFAYDPPFIFIEIDQKNFAREGDSGSLICVEEDEETVSAGFVIVAGNRRNNTYCVYKISDALDLISQLDNNIKPCLISTSKSVKITASRTHRTSLSKKVLKPRQ